MLPAILSWLLLYMAIYQDGPCKKWLLLPMRWGAAKVQKFGSGRQVPTADELRKVLRDFYVDVAF